VDDLKNKRFLRISTLAKRWDMSSDRIYDLLSKGFLKAWHPEGKTGCRGVMVDVKSIADMESKKENFIDIAG